MSHFVRRAIGATVLGSVLIVATACGGNNNTPAADGGPRVDGGAIDGGGGGADGGGGNDGGTPGTSEGESASERTNDTLDTAKAIAVGDTVDGIIGDPVIDSEGTLTDVDVFKFNANAGDVLRLTVSERADYSPGAIIRNRDGSYARVLVGDAASTSATRQLYVPAAGEYFVQVVDSRNSGEESEDVGGAGVLYTFSLARETVTPTAVTLPVAARSGTLSSDNGVQIFSFTATANNGASAEVRAGRLDPPSDVDTILYLVDRSAATPVSIAFNDDIDTNGGVYDSRVRAITSSAGPHVVVLDHYSVQGPNRAFSLDVATFDPGVEQEPNDSLDAANVIAGPTVATPTLVTGSIFKTATGGGIESDLDVFQFSAAAGTYYEINVTKPSGSNAAFVPYVVFVDPEGNVTFANPNTAGRTAARVEAYAFVTGTHYVAVIDARNVAEGATPVGGADYTYQLRISIIPRVVTALGNVPVTTAAQTKLDQGGQTRWFSFVVPAGALKAHAIDLDLGAGAGGNGIALNPYLTLLGTDGVSVLAQATTLYLPDLALESGTYTLAVTDFDGDFDTAAGAAGTHAFKPRVVVTGTYAAVTDDGSHTTRQTAQAVDGDLAVVSASLTAGGQSWYALGSLTAGTAVTLITSAGTGGATVDTKMTLVDGAGVDVPGGSNDDQGLFGPVFAQLLEFPIQATGPYFLRIEGGTETAAGPYRLSVQKNLCGGATPSKLFINEIFANPGSAAAGDANGDAVTNGSDEFVELVNAGRGAASLGGLIVRDLSGARAKFSCGTAVAGGLATTLFGKCSGACAAGRTQSNATPDNPSGGNTTGPGLDLDDAGDAVFLLSRGGVILDRVSYGATSAATSFARGSGGTCDARPPAGAGATQLHNACAGAAGAFSAGKKASNIDFTAPPTLTNDTCAAATPLVSGVLTEGQDTSTFASDYDPSEGATEACDAGGLTFQGKDVAYAIEIPVGKLLTVTVQPTTPWDPAVAIVTDCAQAGATCKALVDDGLDGDLETTTYRNSGDTPLPVFILVDSYADESFGEFDITAAISN